MKQIITLIFLILSALSGQSQIIDFTDLELKRYLIDEACADTSLTGSGFIKPDINNDGEIQFTEADAVFKLDLYDAIPSDYFIKSLQDINHFSKLRYLGMYSLDSLTEISNLQLDSLKGLGIADCLNLRVIDISNLIALTENLSIIGAQDLDYLNIKNGSAAESFTMFYTIRTKYACIDSIASEYDEMINSGAMLNDVLPQTDCETSHTEDVNAISPVEVFPNPTNGILEIKSNGVIEKVVVFNSIGTKVLHFNKPKSVLNFSSLGSGIYILRFSIKGKTFFKKIIKH